MFEVGFTEIILILGIALVVLGPEKLPKVAADIGRWVGRARAMARQFKAQLDEEVVKADRDWTKPAPAQKPKPRSGIEDVDASPNRQAPVSGDSAPPAGPSSTAPPAEPAAEPPPEAGEKPQPGTDSP
jgi:sec-independent protein translocase protein TatB